MAVWLVRAGSHGEYEQKFLQENRIYLTWDYLNSPLDKLDSRNTLINILHQFDTDAKEKKLVNHASQIWPFAHDMQVGDRIILPSKLQPVIYIGKITSGYHHQADAANPFYHWRGVEWLPDAAPRSHFSQDLLYSFGAFLTVCRITRNNAYLDSGATGVISRRIQNKFRDAFHPCP